MIRSLLVALVEVIGVVSLTIGAFLVSAPVGFISFGALALVAAWSASR
jgi:hypothetical protein